MTKSERTSLTASLKSVIDGLNNALSPIDSKDRVCIICEQITVLWSIRDDILKGGASNG